MSASVRFSPSPSPEEDWGEDAYREWPVEGIVGESLDAFGKTRYEIKWGGWRRSDGTNTTWDEAHEDLEIFIRKWEQRQEEKRASKAEKSPAIDIGIEEWHVLHEDRTIERARGYEELKRVYMPDGDPRQRIDLDAMVKPLRPAGDTIQRPGSFKRSTSSLARSDKSTTPGVSASSASSSRGSPAPITGPRPTRPLPRRVRRPISPPVPDSDDERTGAPLPSLPRRQLRRREALQEEWAKRLEGAAPVTFVNDVNYEKVPTLVPGFQYLERSYIRAKNVPNESLAAECLVSCECTGRCTNAERCGCQGPSDLENAAGGKIFAYTKKLLFNFELSRGMEVIECNQRCSCSNNCSNRVAQRPRDVPIEVYMTRHCGWGARAIVALPRGKVLGIFTGLLIQRAEAEAYDNERKTYIFDLDVHEGDDDDSSSERYSVDGYQCGNWTRFINHSCEPNLSVVPVIWDTIPELNQPYLAFVATEDIPAMTELTIDYDPKAGQEARKGKSKHRQMMPEGARECRCGTASCRGWVRV